MQTLGYRGWRRGLVCAVGAALALAPSPTRSDVVRLKDGSTIKGSVLSLLGDTLTVRTTFGAEVRIPRAKIDVVGFTDSLVALLPGADVEPPAAAPPSGSGRVGIAFIDRGLSSKIAAKSRGDREPYIRANWIEQSLIVDDAVVYTRVDTTMDKTIYNGPERSYKNDIELEDFDVEVPAGFHHAILIVRNVGADEYADAFEAEPLDVRLELDNLEVPAGKTVRVKVGITRGRLRMREARLYRVE